MMRKLMMIATMIDDDESDKIYYDCNCYDKVDDDINND